MEEFTCWENKILENNNNKMTKEMGSEVSAQKNNKKLDW
jgi:hypothetical protein